MLRQLALADMGAAAQVHRIAFDQAMPWLAGLHTPDEDRWFYRDRVFPTCRVWGCFDGDVLSGIIAFREGWIEQLYVLPPAQGRSAGSELLDVAKGAYDRLELWTFQRNAPARRFYEARGFELVDESDGSRNEEREPDARYLWERRPLDRRSIVV
ncbi:MULTISPECIES: GNAT family N-acetyltransferase [unclassified Bradyrhizobium]|uniref:GNAT family N-acetyltransferase n=1 Tax=unclassified Bradyrhizobium TaxID=2631580 RepID=UPI0015C73845|nr:MULTISPECIES: GNAT family N-acetyltransferase [unclassified Bradyrhizobium]MBB4259853.1 GNAT superfamily N-acetyltransferase [Bradyrhizobium sp. CIR3A]NYG49515.1 GNAT superfamily N-acetyltransferase [Bradyrhizobium sp. IAR9]